jgi:membrane protein YdbS with pleckstrin-like domain
MTSVGSSTGAEPFEPVGVVWRRVSPRLAFARRLTGCAPLVAMAVVTAVVAVVTTGYLLIAAAGLALGAAWFWWLVGRQVGALRYAERDDDLLVRRGIMWRSIVVVPYGRLQYVDVEAGPVDRIFGIARVQLHTASAGTDAVIPGLPPQEAARVRDRLTSRGQARLAGL